MEISWDHAGILSWRGPCLYRPANGSALRAFSALPSGEQRVWISHEVDTLIILIPFIYYLYIYIYIRNYIDTRILNLRNRVWTHPWTFWSKWLHRMAFQCGNNAVLEARQILHNETPMCLHLGWIVLVKETLFYHRESTSRSSVLHHIEKKQKKTLFGKCTVKNERPCQHSSAPHQAREAKCDPKINQERWTWLTTSTQKNTWIMIIAIHRSTGTILALNHWKHK